MQLPIPGGQITLTELVPAGNFFPPVAAVPSFPPTPSGPFTVPSFCRVALTLTPTSDSDIKTEVWLPENWNGKFTGLGNSGFAGSILYSDLANSLTQGYAVASTDTGHVGGNTDFALNQPEKIIDYGWRAAQEMTIAAKHITTNHYGRDPEFSYFRGCSGGGRMALIQAQRFPDEYDGVLAGSAALSYAQVNGLDMWKAIVNIGSDGKPVLQPEHFSLLAEASMASCDALDGLEDGEIGLPQSCDFQPSTLQCKAGEVSSSNSCLSVEQVNTAEAYYNGIIEPETGRVISTGMAPGSEMGYARASQAVSDFNAAFYRSMVYNDPTWDPTSFNLATDLAYAEEQTSAIISSPALQGFKNSGGKLIQYQGWTESIPPAEDTIAYYQNVAANVGGIDNARDFHRLFVVPNGGHCGGGYEADWFSALENWVEKGQVPDNILAERIGQDQSVLGTRPICPYPEVQTYTGTGDINTASNFVCAIPTP